MTSDGEAERTRALILLLATLDTVVEHLDENRVEDLGLIVRIDELRGFVRGDIEQVRREREG